MCNYISPTSGLGRWDVLATAGIPGEPSGTRAMSKVALKENCAHQLAVTVGISFLSTFRRVGERIEPSGRCSLWTRVKPVFYGTVI